MHRRIHHRESRRLLLLVDVRNDRSRPPEDEVVPGLTDRELDSGKRPVMGFPVAVPDRVGIPDSPFGKPVHQSLCAAVRAPVILRGEEDELLILQGLESVYIPLSADKHAGSKEARIL